MLDRVTCSVRLSLAPAPLAVLLLLVLHAPTAGAQDLEVIYSEVPTSFTSLVPGALDQNGTPVNANFLSMLDLIGSPNGDQWLVRGSTTQGSDLANVMLLGSDTLGTVFAQEGQPIAGGLPGEVYDFFDGVASFDSLGRFAFGARARGGSNAVFEKILLRDGASQAVVIQMGDPALGLQDSTGPAGDELFGNSLNSVHLLDNGDVGFVAVTITNVSSLNRPALFYGDTAFAQSGFTPVGGTTWDGFDSNEFFTTQDGLHWFAMGDTLLSNDVLVVDGMIEIEAGQPLPGTTDVVGAIFHTKMTQDGSWIARGDFADDTDWVMIDGALVARTGDPIVPGSSEVWGDAIGVAYRSEDGQAFVAGGAVDGVGNSAAVLVSLDGAIIARQGDPVDLDGNGLFDDDTFLRSFAPNDLFLSITGNETLYWLGTLEDGTGANLGDAFIRATLSIVDPFFFTRGDCNADGNYNIADAVFLLSFLFPNGTPSVLSCDDACDSNDDSTLNIADAVAALGTLFPQGAPVPLPAPFPDCGPDPTTPDALDCVSFAPCP